MAGQATARTRGASILPTLPFIVLVLTFSGCDGCTEVGAGAWFSSRKNQVRMALATPCESVADCTALICKQGAVCAKYIGGRDVRSVCECIERRLPPCQNAVDCGPKEQCVHYPRSTVGSCVPEGHDANDGGIE
jgi:hypothetical protein